MYHVKWSEPFLAEEATESSHQAQLCDCTAQVSAGRGPARGPPSPRPPVSTLCCQQDAASVTGESCAQPSSGSAFCTGTKCLTACIRVPESSPATSCSPAASQLLPSSFQLLSPQDKSWPSPAGGWGHVCRGATLQHESEKLRLDWRTLDLQLHLPPGLGGQEHRPEEWMNV